MEKLLSEIVSENIKTLLAELGEDSVSASKKSGIDQKTVWNYTQADRCNPTIKKIDALAKALKVHPSLLMVESAFVNGVPDSKSAELPRRILELSPSARRQVMEFIEMWEQVKDS
jgi:transcriptional regulator with XRE-family HTH domain